MPIFAEKFAKDLRGLVLGRGTIAQACAATGINRQQFNKYLAGQIMPGARNMRKICTYLGVSEEQLVTGRASAAGSSSASASAIDNNAVPSGLDTLQKANHRHASADASASVLPDGFYDCYFPLRAASGTLVRWLLAVKSGPQGQTFSCRTFIRSPDVDSYGAARKLYHGVILQGLREAYFIGTSKMPQHQPTVLGVNTLPLVGRSYFSGLALTHRLEGPLAITVALHFKGRNYPARAALASVGLIGLDDPALDPVIASMMRSTPSAGTNWLQSVNGRNLGRASRPAGPEMAAALALRRRLPV